MKVLITGGSGFIGQHLCRRLAAHGHELTVLTRKPRKAARVLPEGARLVTSLDDIENDAAIDGIVNLAGESLFAGRWTERRKKALFASRVGVTEGVVGLVSRLDRKPAVLVSGSAVGVRLCLVRTGIVLGSDGGMLSKLLPVYRLGLGAMLGDGNQWLSWVHIDDMVAVLVRALETPGVDGVFNACAPAPVTQREFHHSLARKVKRPALLRVPSAALKAGLGEQSAMLIGGQRVYPRRLEQQGFIFRFPDLDSALSHLIRR